MVGANQSLTTPLPRCRPNLFLLTYGLFPGVSWFSFAPSFWLHTRFCITIRHSNLINKVKVCKIKNLFHSYSYSAAGAHRYISLGLIHCTPKLRAWSMGQFLTWSITIISPVSYLTSWNKIKHVNQWHLIMINSLWNVSCCFIQSITF